MRCREDAAQGDAAQRGCGAGRMRCQRGCGAGGDAVQEGCGAGRDVAQGDKKEESPSPCMQQDNGLSGKIRRRLPTLPLDAVPSARSGLTSLFGMGRGGTPAL